MKIIKFTSSFLFFCSFFFTGERVFAQKGICRVLVNQIHESPDAMNVEKQMLIGEFYFILGNFETRIIDHKETGIKILAGISQSKSRLYGENSETINLTLGFLKHPTVNNPVRAVNAGSPVKNWKGASLGGNYEFDESRTYNLLLVCKKIKK